MKTTSFYFLKKKYFSYLIIGSLSYILFTIIYPYGLGVSPDSVIYIEAAKNLSDGNGYVTEERFITHWPPGYSFLLSFTSKITHCDVQQIGKYLNIFLFIILGITYKLTLDEMQFSYIVKYYLIAMFLFSIPLTVSLMYWSELPFMVFITIAYFCLQKWKSSDKKSILLIAGTFSFFALLTRYAAIGFLGGFCLNILFEKNSSARKRKLDIISYVLPIFIGIAFWLYYALYNRATTASREFSVHIISFNKIIESIKILIFWFGGGKISRISFLLFLLMTAYILYRKKNKLKSYLENYSITNILQILVIIISYFIFLLISISFFDAYTPLDNRILSPISSFIFLLLGFLMNFLALNSSKWYTNVALIFICFSCINSSKNVWINHYENGTDYSGKQYKLYSDIIKEYVESSQVETHTNGSVFVKFYSNYRLYLKSLPLKVNPSSRKFNENYLEDINKMRINISNGKAQVLYFDRLDWREGFIISKEELLNLLQDQRLIIFDGGFVIRAKDKKE